MPHFLLQDQTGDVHTSGRSACLYDDPDSRSNENTGINYGYQPFFHVKAMYSRALLTARAAG